MTEAKTILDTITNQAAELLYVNIKPSILILGTRSHKELRDELNNMVRNADTHNVINLTIHGYVLEVIICPQDEKILVCGREKDY